MRASLRKGKPRYGELIIPRLRRGNSKESPRKVSNVLPIAEQLHVGLRFATPTYP